MIAKTNQGVKDLPRLRIEPDPQPVVIAMSYYDPIKRFSLRNGTLNAISDRPGFFEQ